MIAKSRILLQVTVALLASAFVALYWTAGHAIFVVMQSFMAPEKTAFGAVHLGLLGAVALVFAYLSSRYPLKSLITGTAVFSLVWIILTIILAKFAAIDLIAAPVLLVIVIVLAVSHLARLWLIDSELTKRLVGLASIGNRVSGVTPEMRVETGLRLLETIFPVAEVIVFKLHLNGEIVPVGRARKEHGTSSNTARNTSWQHNVSLCEQAISEGNTIVMPSEYRENAASLAVPLVCEDETIGVLFVDIKDDYQPADKMLLESFGSQLARNFQRNDLKSKHLPHTTWWGTFSTQSTENRLHVTSLVDGVIKEKSFGTLATAHLNEAHAVAYLDGTLAYLNPNIAQLARLSEDDLKTVDLFSLLDRFRTLVFNDPSLAIRRVLQSGKLYSCELDFPEDGTILQLQIIPVKLPSSEESRKQDSGDVEQPACLLITLQNIAAKKENERLRSDMASLMSHELRTPITSINGFAEMLLLDGTIPAEAREYLSIISSESQRASSILSNFLSVSNLEQADKTDVDKVPVRVNNLVREVVDELQESAKQKRIRIVEKQSPDIPPVSADRGLIMKAITHLLDNAIKYSPERTSVMISTILEADFLRVDIEDRGYGIPKGEQQKIWQKFYRVARDGQDKEEESTGLGLSLVKEIIEQHNGEVSVVSAEGKGSRFSFRLPRL